METYLHRVIGLYPDHDSAESAREEILAGGLTPQQARILAPGSMRSAQDGVADSDDVLKDLMRDGAIGAAAGTAAGAGASIALAAANITLFVASPVLGALYLLGWGASLGGLVGAAVGSERSKGDVPGLIRDALAGGHFVLVVQAATADQASLAQRIVGTSMSGSAEPSRFEAPTTVPAET